MRTYTLDGVGTGGPDQHRDPLVLLVGVDIQSHFVSGQVEGGDHLSDAAGEQVPEGHTVSSVNVQVTLLCANTSASSIKISDVPNSDYC